MIPLSISGPFSPLCWYVAGSPYDWEKMERRIFKIKHSSSNPVICFANLPCGVPVKNSGQAENWGLNRTHIGSGSSNTQFGKYELFQCIESAEQLFTFVLLVFCQLSALKWFSKPMVKGAEEGVWPEARGDKKAASSQMALGCYRAPACISCCFHLPLARQEVRWGAVPCREMGTQLQEKENSSTPVAL